MTHTVDALALWQWLPLGYVMTVALEAPVLLLGLRRHSVWQRLAAAFWLTAATYPIVTIVLPLILWPRVSYGTYVLIAEAFAIAAECLLFRLVWHGTRRDLIVVALANLVSASVGWMAAG